MEKINAVTLITICKHLNEFDIGMLAGVNKNLRRMIKKYYYKKSYNSLAVRIFHRDIDLLRKLILIPPHELHVYKTKIWDLEIPRTIPRLYLILANIYSHIGVTISDLETIYKFINFINVLYKVYFISENRHTVEKKIRKFYKEKSGKKNYYGPFNYNRRKMILYKIKEKVVFDNLSLYLKILRANRNSYDHKFYDNLSIYPSIFAFKIIDRINPKCFCMGCRTDTLPCINIMGISEDEFMNMKDVNNEPINELRDIHVYDLDKKPILIIS